jgi:glycosyltransferase involved in cell wall biosynthesis
MRIVIEASCIAPERMSGVGHVTLELIYALRNRFKDDNAHMLTVVVPWGTTRQLLARHKLDGIQLRSLPPFSRAVNYILTRTSLPIPMDVLYGKGVYIFPDYKNWYLGFSKSLTFIHDLAFLLFPETVNPKTRAYLTSNVHRWLRRTTKIVTDSESSRNDIIAQYGPSLRVKPELVLLGVDHAKYFPRPTSEIEVVRKKYGLTKPYLLFVGNIEPRKNIDKLIAAYRLLPRNVIDEYSLLLIGGDGWNNESTKLAIRQAQADNVSVIWPGQIVPDQDMPALYSGASLFVHPALYEGFGMTPLEAMATATPMVVSNRSSLPEVVGEVGMYIDPDDTQQLSDRIKALLADPKQRSDLGQAGLRQAEQFSWDKTAETVMQIAKAL